MNLRPRQPISGLRWPALVAMALILPVWLASSQSLSAAFAGLPDHDDATSADAISPYWNPEIQLMGSEIVRASRAYGFHPDLVAAIINQELAAEMGGQSHESTTGLMRVALTDPVSRTISSQDLKWGMSVLSYVLQQSGGDLLTALSAYHGGWTRASSDAPDAFAAEVLDSYARAMLAKSGISPDSAIQWALAVEVRSGNVPVEPFMYLGTRSQLALKEVAHHTVYSYGNESGGVYHLHAYMAPVSLAGALPDKSSGFGPDTLEPQLRQFLGDKSARSASGELQLLMACLPTLERLQGLIMTRWYAPAACPAADR